MFRQICRIRGLAIHAVIFRKLVVVPGATTVVFTSRRRQGAVVFVGREVYDCRLILRRLRLNHDVEQLHQIEGVRGSKICPILKRNACPILI